MSMMDVRVVYVTMDKVGMRVWVAMRFWTNLVREMIVFVMLVVHMTMSVVKSVVGVKVLMPFCRAKQYTNPHSQ